MSVVSVYSTFADDDEAQRIGRILVEERLAACVNLLGPVQSIYRWKGNIETSDEVAAIMKTSEAKVDALISRIAGLHSYEVPAIVTWPIDKILGVYADWIEDNVA